MTVSYPSFAPEMSSRGGKATATRAAAAPPAPEPTATEQAIAASLPASPSEDEQAERLDRLEAHVALLQDSLHGTLSETLQQIQQQMQQQSQQIQQQFQNMQLLIAQRSPRLSRNASPVQLPAVPAASRPPQPNNPAKPTSESVSARIPELIPTSEASSPPPIATETLAGHEEWLKRVLSRESRDRTVPLPKKAAEPSPASNLFPNPAPPSQQFYQAPPIPFTLIPPAATGPGPPATTAPSLPPLPGPRLPNGHLDLDRLAKPRDGPVYRDTLALTEWIRQSWADVIAAEDLAHEEDLRTAKNAARPFITSVKFLSVSDPSTLKNLASVQAQLEAELSPYASWPVRVRLLFEEDFYLIQRFILLQRPTWLLVVEAILEIL